jgi:hypothetical protein
MAHPRGISGKRGAVAGHRSLNAAERKIMAHPRRISGMKQAALTRTVLKTKINWSAIQQRHGQSR